MVPIQQDSRLCLILLLGLLGMVISLHAPPDTLTWAQWFEIQHINMAHPQCNAAMRVVNGYRMVCKNKNTFLHRTFAYVAGICNTPNVTCSTSGRMNCHNSSVQVPITYCNLTRKARNYTDCRYQQTRAWRIFIVACENRSPRDSPRYPVVPVHLDNII
ncbi:non-secretory ribonuclease-like [Bos indicus x Bos taurus]|uniref:non-secretory ribonuclease-like n=1 Tax=Bos indicus x Bos taurus TaxID=30522 RepID=UPI000F7D0D4C|nr:non-secretory ribonuclease-like [Bos indicus x Bos taurus]XP_027391664.1 non-secretory ribonuclease-like [Bos indicus x Bos taurus]